jgi:hypothetical protein
MRTCLFVLLCTLALPLAGQQPGVQDSLPQRLVRTRDGNEFLGTVVRETADTLVLQTNGYGLVSIPTAQIRRSRTLASNAAPGSRFWFDGPLDARYFLGANAFGLRAGEGYYQNVWISLNQADVALNDYFSVGCGSVPLVIFGGLLPVWVTPRVSVPLVKDRLHLGGGAWIGSIFAATAENRTSFGYLYGQATWGKRDANISLGGGYTYSNGIWGQSPVLSLSAMYRAGKKLALITENYRFGVQGDRALVFSGGVRVIGKFISLDAAIVLLGNEFGVFGVPLLSIATPFGNAGARAKKRAGSQ